MEHGGGFGEGALAGAGSLLFLAISIFLFYVFVRFVRKGFRRLGLQPALVSLILWGSLVGSAISLPMFPFGEGQIGINVGGAIVPLAVSVYLLATKRVPANEALVGVILVTIAAYLVTDYEPGLGVISPFPLYLIPPALAGLIAAAAYWQEREDAAGLAYVAGSLGTVIGADLVRLPEILAGPPLDDGVVLAIGGAGVFDMVFLSGILAVAFQASQILQAASARIEGAFGGSPEAAIEDEFAGWMGDRAKDDQRRDGVRAQRAATMPRRTQVEAWQPADQGRSRGERDGRTERAPTKAAPRRLADERTDRARKRVAEVRAARRERSRKAREQRRARAARTAARPKPSERYRQAKRDERTAREA